MTTHSSWPGPITAITLFVEEVGVAKEFYARAFDLPVHYEDDASAVFRFGSTLINLLVATEAPSLITPVVPGGPEAGPRVQLTLDVDDVDDTCRSLAERGVTLLNGPMNRPWGIRTASFRDPAGHIWEIAAPLPG